MKLFLSRKLALLLLCFVSNFYLFGQKTISLEDIYVNGKFTVKSVPGFNVTDDGLHYLKIDKKDGIQIINKYNLATNTLVEKIYEHKADEPLAKYEINKHNTYILTFTNPQSIYRRSTKYTVSLQKLNNSAPPKLLHDGKSLLHASFNPEGDKIAYVLDNNLYVYDLIKGKTSIITTDGEQNAIINGNCDWVYEEEFGFSQAYQWSPDGKYIAYYKFDEREVKEFNMQYFFKEENYPINYTFKYPKAGEDNAIVNIYTYNVHTQTNTKMDVGSNTDQYIPRIKWASNDKLCIFRLNRHQNNLEFIYSNPTEGTGKVVYEEQNKYYIEINDNVFFAQNGEKILYTSEKNGYNHLYLHNITNNKSQQITKGNWDIDEIISIDHNKHKIYFTAGINSPLERQFYEINWNNKNITTILNEAGWHNITSCNGNKYFVVKHQSHTQVPTFRLINNSGKLVRKLEDNHTLQNNINELNLKPIYYTQIPNSNNELLNAYIIFPPQFDSNTQYPVLLYQYSGPGSQQVMNKFQLDHYMWHRYLAQEGYIVVVADGTGTGARGEEFKKKTYLQLGNLESNDQIDIAKWLGNQTYVNANRIGIWGWSYGGFMSSICLFKAPEIFKSAIAVAPVTNWRYYDNIYTERYMRTPQENPNGYDDNAPLNMAKNLIGNFLLIHGLADDNVHFQNAIALTNELIRNNKQFRSEYYPNGNHGIGGGVVRFQLFKRMTDFIFKEL
jgi:dipeptidyl-peptidase-4